MSILNQDLLFALAALAYLALGTHFWRTRWGAGADSTAKPMAAWERTAIGATLLLHGLALNGALFTAGSMVFSFSLALSMMLCLAVLIYWIESFAARLEGMQPLILLLAALSTALPALFPKAHALAHAGSLGFRFHFLTAMAAYSLFTLSAIQTLFMGFAEKRLHRRTMSRALASLPPLLTMEALLFRMVTLAFILLTVALGSGIFFSEAIYGKPLSLDHKTVFAFASWLIYGALLTGRHMYGWRGRVAQRWLLSGFVVLLLAYVGSRFVVEVILGR
jgi:ABC-type uncharacterized transport system permease subunit